MPTPVTELLFFNELKSMNGLATIIADCCGEYFSKLKNPDGTESTQPAIFLGGVQNITPEPVYCVLTYQGDVDSHGDIFAKGTAEYPNPEDENETLYAPYTQTYTVYSITVTIDAGSYEVNVGDYANNLVSGDDPTRLTAEQLLRKLRKYLLRDGTLDKIETRMDSTVRKINNVNSTPQQNDEKTLIKNIATMTMFFNTIDTEVDYDTGWFDTIEGNYEYYRHEDDPDPITGTITVETPED